MFGLFKSKKQEQVATLNATPAASIYPALVHEIHNEFLTAGDRILEEARGIIRECEGEQVDKGKRLASLGFEKVPEAVRAIRLETKAVRTKEIADLVVYYQLHYPNHKLITEEQVEIICEKYGLVCGDVSMYKGFVPEKNLQQIESFKLKKAEENVLIADNGYLFENAEIRKCGCYFHIFKKGESDRYKYAFQSNDGVNFYAHDSKNIFGYLTAGGAGFSMISRALQICAPLKDMEIPEGKRLQGHKIKNIPDPVVLMPVKGGYLIVAAWGDEASDDVVVNQKMN